MVIMRQCLVEYLIKPDAQVTLVEVILQELAFNRLLQTTILVLKIYQVLIQVLPVERGELLAQSLTVWVVFQAIISDLEEEGSCLWRMSVTGY